ncbi:MAG: S9 family peptidase [Bacteroidales bacterium]|nr:S9 family peptidase [Bacteroidales bacterium]
MKMYRNAFLMLSLALLSVAATAQVKKESFQLKDVRKMVRLSDPKISPNGKMVAVIVSRADWENDKSKQQIELINCSDASSRSITYQRKGISELSWSPDGTKLAFLAHDGATDRAQVFVMPMDGGDAIRVTDSKTGVDLYSWSPDGKQIAYIAQDTIPNPKQIKHHEDAFKVTDNNYEVRAAIEPWHLWLVSSTGKDAKRLTSGSWSLGTDQGSISKPAWTPDGKSIVFQQFPDVWEGNAWHSVLGEVNVATGKIDTLVSDQGSSTPKYEPNGSVLAFSRPRNGDQNNGNAVYILKDGKITDITAAMNRNINNFVWIPGQNTLLLAAEKGTHTVAWELPLDGSSKQLNLDDIDISSWSLSFSHNGSFVFTGSTPEHPTELYYMSSVSAQPKQLTHLNDFADSLSLGKSVGVNWKGPDGFDEDGVLTYPTHFEKGKKYPMVLVIHGGPEAASTLSFSPLTQLLAAKGFLVFEPNYRGSTNLGDAYQHAIYRNTGKGPGEDVMAGVKKVEDMGIVDESRIGVSGWSYGGYMTSWLIGYYPEVWKAAVSGAALNDWVMDYTIAYYQKGDLYFFGGSPWAKKYWKIWRDQSPIAYSTRVKAPTLIMGDAGDPNVPIVNSYEMFHSLRDNGVTVEFYVYPADTHFPSDIVRTTDIYGKWVDWFVKYLK